MARIALPNRYERPPNALLAAAALLVSAGALAGVLSMVQVPSSGVQGLPVDWGQRAGWLAVEALAGLGVACALLAAARRAHRQT